MNQFTKKLSSLISDMKPRDFVYVGIIFTFFVAVSVLFFYSTKFITKNINNIFLSEEAEGAGALNIQNYTLVAKKLGISNETKEKVAPAATETTPLSTTTVPTLDKTSLTITILNSTTKSGVAAALSKLLESAGLSKATTGNEKTKYATTTIKIKEGITSFGPEILEEVRKIYPTAIATTTPETAKFDITIIIGSN